MLGCESIVKLYNDVLENDILQHCILESDIQVGIISMAKVYEPMNGKKIDRSVVVDFNDAAHRCAYLHRFASLHTAMVRDFMFSAIRQNYDFFRDLLFSESPFKMCSLGGGPGSDVVGVLASLMYTFNHLNSFDFSATVIDYMAEWSKTFYSVMTELTSGRHGNFGRAAGQSLRWRYLGANLLKSLDPEVEREISSASLITAIKFVSAANCKDTESMVENIFSAMKPGAVFFFVDNAGGGFIEFILDSAVKFNFIPKFGPIRRKEYSNHVVKVRRFGNLSCNKINVSVAILQKPYEVQPRLRITVPNAEEDNLLLGSECSRKVDDYCSSSSSTDGFETPIIPLLDSHELKREEYHDKAPSVPNTPLTPYVFHLFDDAFTPDLPDTADSAKTSRRDRNRIQIKNGCLPLLKMKNWRHHLSTKLNSFKSHFQSKRGIKKK